MTAAEAIRKGDLDALRLLLAQHPRLVNERADGCRTLLHVATDWPGHFPNNVATVALLLDHGAVIDAPFVGRHSETPLHWAASCDDVEVIAVLLDRGANLEAPGGVIAGGTPLADAVAFGQWRAAHLLIERGARANLWQAAALGLMARVETYFVAGAGADPVSPQEITKAFWCACHGGQRETAEFLLARGADPRWVGYDKLTPIETARRSGAASVVEWLERSVLT
jgi:uncharacterized protein